MDGDDRFAAWAVGRDKVGTVQNVQAEAHQLDVQRVAFKTVMAGRPQGDPAEVGLLQNGGVVLAALQEDVFICPVYPRQAVDQVKDVLADAGLAVEHQPGVDSNAHGCSALGKYATKRPP